MSAGTSTKQSPGRRGIRLSHLVWMVIVAVAVAGELILRAGHDNPLTQFAAPVRPLAAFHVITPADIRPLWRPRDRVPKTAARDATVLVGRVTLQRLESDSPVVPSAVGPTATADMKGDLTVVGVPATPAMALDDRLHAGDRVNVVAAGVTAGLLTVVLDVRRTGGPSERPFVVLLAVPPATPLSVVRALASGQAALVRVVSP